MPDRLFDVHGEQELNLSNTPRVFLLVFKSPADGSRLQYSGLVTSDWTIEFPAYWVGSRLVPGRFGSQFRMLLGLESVGSFACSWCERQKLWCQKLTASSSVE